MNSITMKVSAFAILVLVITSISSSVSAEDLELINRPVNTSGLTGLIMTTTPFTLPRKTVEIGLSSISEKSLVPKYTSTVMPLTISMGFSTNKEIGLLVPYRYVDLDTAGKERGMGDTELSFKWNALPQPEYGNRPGIALFGTAVMPSGDREAGLNSVTHWGCRLGLSVGSELEWKDLVIGLYMDGQGSVQDVSDPVLRDSYGLLNAGLLVPISKYRNLQAMVEYNLRSGKDIVTVDGLDFSAVTYGLRLVGERFNMTFGVQLVNKTDSGLEDSSRTIASLSVKL